MTIGAILLDGRHIFYTCQDKADMVLELEFDLSETRDGTITVQAMPVWFDWDIESKEKQFVVGLKFLADTKSPEIKTLSQEACKDEKRLVSLWKKLF